jgi:hypothetical protein
MPCVSETIRPKGAGAETMPIVRVFEDLDVAERYFRRAARTVARAKRVLLRLHGKG